MITPAKIFTAAQIKQADQFTILHEPVSSINLMERASLQFVEWIKQHTGKTKNFFIFCGPGNNGGDGLAIARLLHLSGFTVTAFILETGSNQSPDCKTNEERLKAIDTSLLKRITSIAELPDIHKDNIIIDAIFGTGLSRPVNGLAADCIDHINQSGAMIISVDISSGLFADVFADPSSPIIKANHTVSFQFPKLAFFFPGNAAFVGDWHLVNIGLSETFTEQEHTDHYMITKELVKSIFKPRQKFSHKGSFGHALLVAGSYGKIGAAVLSANACLRCGVGLLTIHLPQCGNDIMQVANPEAMVSNDDHQKYISDKINTEKYSATGIGPGIGVDEYTQKALHHLLTHTVKPLVIDADALNILSLNKDWLKSIPANSILTPHPKEFERLAGKAANDFDRLAMQKAFSKQYNVFVILKGAHTSITAPSGETYFNTTGNSGMAKGGSGDVLTGIVTGILAQGYTSLETCLLSVFIHGYAGDLAKESVGEIGMTAGDLCKFLPEAFKQLHSQAN